MNAATRHRASLVGRNIRTARKLAGVKQEQLADMIGKPRNRLSEWETGRHEPRAHTLALIAEALDQPLQFFYTDHYAEEAEAVA